MDRTEWLTKVRLQSEVLYDHIAPAYWDTFGLYPNASHQRYVNKILVGWQPTAPSSMQPVAPDVMMAC